MAKKLFFLLVLFLALGEVFFPLTSLASGVYRTCEDETCQSSKDVYYEGLVPCGKEVCEASGSSLSKSAIDKKIGEDKESFKDACESSSGNIVQINCQLCHTFVMAKGIVDFFLIYIIPPLAILIITIGGIMFYFGGANPSYVSKGITLMKTVAIGLFLIYGAFMIIGMFLGSLGAAEWTGLTKGGWYKIKCAIQLP